MVQRGVVGHGLAGSGLARPRTLLSLKDAKENPDHHRRPSTGGLLFCPLESPGVSPRCPLGLASLPKRQKFGHWRAGMAFFERYSATAWQRHGSHTVSRRIRNPLLCLAAHLITPRADQSERFARTTPNSLSASLSTGEKICGYLGTIGTAFRHAFTSEKPCKTE